MKAGETRYITPHYYIKIISHDFGLYKNQRFRTIFIMKKNESRSVLILKNESWLFIHDLCNRPNFFCTIYSDSPILILTIFTVFFFDRGKNVFHDLMTTIFFTIHSERRRKKKTVKSGFFHDRSGEDFFLKIVRKNIGVRNCEISFL
jgi:hypothetical protein